MKKTVEQALHKGNSNSLAATFTRPVILALLSISSRIYSWTSEYQAIDITLFGREREGFTFLHSKPFLLFLAF